jgi:hypothetical protein
MLLLGVHGMDDVLFTRGTIHIIQLNPTRNLWSGRGLLLPSIAPEYMTRVHTYMPYLL